jgi:uncharacterized coiled-coil DUF342 family protein
VPKFTEFFFASVKDRLNRRAIVERLREHTNKKNEIKQEISDTQSKIARFRKEIEELWDQINGLTESLGNEKGSPSVKVRDLIFEKTIIKGPHSSLVLEENEQDVLIREAEITNDEALSKSILQWHMIISRPH